jgi:hypothetical protein
VVGPCAGVPDGMGNRTPGASASALRPTLSDAHELIFCQWGDERAPRASRLGLGARNRRTARMRTQGSRPPLVVVGEERPQPRASPPT